MFEIIIMSIKNDHENLTIFKKIFELQSNVSFTAPIPKYYATNEIVTYLGCNFGRVLDYKSEQIELENLSFRLLQREPSVKKMFKKLSL